MKTCRRCLLLLAVLLSLTAPGCAWLNPPPPPLPADGVACVLQERASAFDGLQADMRLRIATTVDGDTNALPTLSGVLAFHPGLPAMFMRAEKFTQEVFTLRATGPRFALRFPRTHEVVIGGPFAYQRVPYLLRPSEIKGAFAGPDILGLTWADTQMTVADEHYCFESRVLGTLYRRVRVDRRRLVVTDIEQFDALGRLHTAVRMQDYVSLGKTAAPLRLVVERHQVSTRPPLSVTVRLKLSELEPLKEGATALMRPRVPPGWRVVDLDREPLSNIRALDPR